METFKGRIAYVIISFGLISGWMIFNHQARAKSEQGFLLLSASQNSIQKTRIFALQDTIPENKVYHAVDKMPKLKIPLKAFYQK